MHLPLIIAFGAKLALGHFSNSSDPWPQSHDDAAAATQPWVVGDFRFFGCAASSAGFPLFKKVAFTDFMNLDFCAASCPGKYFGTSDTDCYCGDELDAESSDKVDSDQCDTPCPGDGSQICGGHAASAWPAHEKQESESVILSLYIKLGEDHHEHDQKQEDTCEDEDEEDHHHGGWQFTRPPPHQTYTSTITSTTTSTITSCPPDVQHCPVGNKVTQAVTVTTELCPAPEWSKKKITCYGDLCAPEEPCHDDDEQCQHQRVVCHGDSCHPEPCSDKDEWHKLVVCDGDDSSSECHYRQCAGEECATKIVCYDGHCAKQKCWGDECRANLVCKGPECRHEACGEEECHEHRVCDESGDCQARPPCSGPECPVPPPPSSAAKPEVPPPAAAPTQQHGPAGHQTGYPQPAAPTNGYSLPRPTGVPVVAGSTKLGATLFGVLLSFVVFL
ncbi:hypothetical protein V8C44DRAFT_365682 [Trichoderma aethiopicum]